jgi:hypothetical protein
MALVAANSGVEFLAVVRVLGMEERSHKQDQDQLVHFFLPNAAA